MNWPGNSVEGISASNSHGLLCSPTTYERSERCKQLTFLHLSKNDFHWDGSKARSLRLLQNPRTSGLIHKCLRSPNGNREVENADKMNIRWHKNPLWLDIRMKSKSGQSIPMWLCDMTNQNEANLSQWDQRNGFKDDWPKIAKPDKNSNRNWPSQTRFRKIMRRILPGK